MVSWPSACIGIGKMLTHVRPLNLEVALGTRSCQQSVAGLNLAVIVVLGVLVSPSSSGHECKSYQTEMAFRMGAPEPGSPRM